MCWAADFGYRLGAQQEALAGSLIVITAPCQSVLPAAVALGYLIRQLEAPLPESGIESHFDMLWNMPVGSQVKYLLKGKKTPDTYEILKDREPGEYIKIRCVAGRRQRRLSGTVAQLPFAKCVEYQPVDSESNGANSTDSLSPYPAARQLKSISEAIPESQNWQKKLEGISIVGPTNGNSSPRRHFDSCAFVFEDETRVTFSDLLAVGEWKASKHTPTYSRFVSSARNHKIGGEAVEQSELVIFTSPEAYRRYDSKLDRQIKVLVISRDLDESKLEILDLMLRKYLKDPAPRELSVSLPKPPDGIQLLALGEKPEAETSW